MVEGLLDGTIDCIATDHAPHSAEEKSKGLRGSAMGIVGLETAFPVLYTKLVETGAVRAARIAVKHGRHLLSGDVVVNAKRSLTVTVDKLLLGSPVNGVSIPHAVGYIRKAANGRGRRLPAVYLSQFLNVRRNWAVSYVR